MELTRQRRCTRPPSGVSAALGVELARQRSYTQPYSNVSAALQAELTHQRGYRQPYSNVSAALQAELTHQRVCTSDAHILQTSARLTSSAHGNSDASAAPQVDYGHFLAGGQVRLRLRCRFAYQRVVLAPARVRAQRYSRRCTRLKTPLRRD